MSNATASLVLRSARVASDVEHVATEAPATTERKPVEFYPGAVMNVIKSGALRIESMTFKNGETREVGILTLPASLKSQYKGLYLALLGAVRDRIQSITDKDGNPIIDDKTGAPAKRLILNYYSKPDANGNAQIAFLGTEAYYAWITSLTTRDQSPAVDEVESADSDRFAETEF